MFSNRQANLLTDIGLVIALIGTLVVQFFFHEAPCELCLLQRLALIGAAAGFFMNWRFGISPVHYAVAQLSALFGMIVAIRQITLHIIPGTGSYGDAWNGMQKTLHWLEGLSQVRYQFIAYDSMGHLLLDLGLNELAVEHLQRGIALGDKTGIMYWRVALCTHLAIAQTRLGQKVDVSALLSMLDDSRASSERYMMVRCLEGLAEIALAAGDDMGCCAYADELLAIAQTNGMNEMEAVAWRWRGEALLVKRDFVAAETELTLAATLFEKVGRTRLHMDTQVLLARVFEAQGKSDVSKRHNTATREIGEAIFNSLTSSTLVAKLNLSC